MWVLSGSILMFSTFYRSYSIQLKLVLHLTIMWWNVNNKIGWKSNFLQNNMTIESVCVLIQVFLPPPSTVLTIEFEMVIFFWACSPIPINTSLVGTTHTSLKYMCLIKMSNIVRSAYLMDRSKEMKVWSGVDVAWSIFLANFGSLHSR